MRHHSLPFRCFRGVYLGFAAAIIVGAPFARGDDATTRWVAHDEDVHDIAWSPVANLLATASFDRTVKLWTPGGIEPVAVLGGHDGRVFTVEFSPDGSRVVTASDDGKVRILRLPLPASRDLGPAALDGKGGAWTWRLEGDAVIVSRDEAGAAVLRVPVGRDARGIAVDGDRLFAVSPSGELRAWSLAPPREEAGTRVLVPADAEWRFAKGTKAPAATWATADFDDSSWEKAGGGFGYSSDEDELRRVTTRLDDMAGPEGYASVFVRGTFELAEPKRVTALRLRITIDDGFVASINGTEVARGNVSGEPPAFDRNADAATEPSETVVDLADARSLLRSGRNVLAIQGHNVGSSSSDFVLIAALEADLGAEAAPAAPSIGEPTRLAADGIAAFVVAPGGEQIAWSNGSTVGVSDASSGVTSWSLDAREARLAWVDGSRLAIGDARGVRIADGSGDSLRVLEGHDGPITALATSGNSIVAGGASGRVAVWVLGGEAPRLTLAAHEGAVRGVAIAPDGSRVATSGADDRRVAVWSLDAGDLVQVFDTAGGADLDAMSPDGAVTGSVAGRRLEWRVPTRSEPLVLAGHGGLVHMAVFSPDGERVASVGADKTLRIWSAVDGKELRKIDAHESSVYCVAWSPDGAAIATGGYDGKVRLWNAATGESLAELAEHGEGVSSLVFAPSGGRLWSASFDGTVREWDVAGRAQARVLDHLEGWVLGVRVSPDGAALAAVDFGGRFVVWDLGSGAVRETRALPPVTYDFAWSKDGRLVAACHRAGAVTLTTLGE